MHYFVTQMSFSLVNFKLWPWSDNNAPGCSAKCLAINKLTLAGTRSRQIARRGGVKRCVCFTEVRGTCRKQFCLFWLPELWILRYPAHRYRAMPSPGFEPTTLRLRVRRPNHMATTFHGKTFWDTL
jgi:hypothetical protein